MKRDYIKPAVYIVSRWGDCVVRRGERGEVVEIRYPNGRVRSAEKDKGGHKPLKHEVTKQIELFSADDYS